jgi:hypothetical protein
MPAIVYSALHPTALPTMVSTVTHQHAGSGGGLKDVVDTFDAKSTAFFVVSGTDVMGDTFGLRSCNEIQVVWVIL